jgi:hypothetical protein
MPRRSKHPLSTGHTRREPTSLIMNAELSAVFQSQCAKYGLTIRVKKMSTYGSSKVCNYKLDHCNGYRTCEMMTSNKTVEIPVTSTCLSVLYPTKKRIVCRTEPCISNQFRDIYDICR